MGRHPKQFCPREHDTWAVGRASNGRCRECGRLDNLGLLPPPERRDRIPFSPLEAWLLAGVAVKAYDEALQRNVYRWRAQGIPLYTADEVCCEVLGVHPHQVYGDRWFTFGEELEEASA
jgi:hypothetical protein